MRSLWLQEALVEDGTSPRLQGKERADICVIGGGYTGLWTALRLKEHEPSADVVVLEADVCGGGQSGRNGGLVLSWWSKFPALELACGTEEALRLARAADDAVAAVGEFCREHGIGAAYASTPWVWVATSAPWLGAWLPVVERLAGLGERPFREISADEARALARSPRALGGVVEETAGVVQPAALARGLRRIALDRGVRIFERSPASALEPGVVLGSAGSVSAERVVVALGPWAVRLRGLKRALAVVSSDMVATEPIPDWAGALRACISDARPRVEYYRTTPDGRLIFGKGGGTLAFGSRVGRAFDGASPHRAEVEAALRRVHPALAGVRVAASWTGPVDRSRSGLPFFVRLREGVVCGAGYSGRGVAQAYLGGRILASLALDLDDEWSRCGLVGWPQRRFPPEPLRYAGGVVLRRAVAASERADDAGRRPPRLASAVVRLAPSGLLPARAASRMTRDDPSRRAAPS